MSPVRDNSSHSTSFNQADIAKHSFHARKPVEALITNDHRSFEELYDRFFQHKGNQDEQQAIVNEFIREVAQHSIAEELVVYPKIEKVNLLGSGEQIADHLRADHAQVKDLLYQLDQMKVGDEGFEKLFTKTIQTLKEHAHEEETKELPALAKQLSEADRIELSKSFLRHKVIAPTHSHPSAPDKPAILELLAGLPIAPIDKLRDQTRRFAERRVPQE
ncbi:HHE domain-containing protein [Gaertneriomyces semiglobifer]|nr:HHE domain-containing protein [Gaertneriomyces semiglobifer]